MTKLDKFRVSILVGACVFLGGGWVARAHAAEAACRPLAEMKESAAKHNATWTKLSSEQFQFMRGVSVTAPHTPPYIPFGDSAALVRFGDGGAIVFVDGDKGCELMPIPAELIEMMMHLGNVSHEGDGM